ncbi:MAG: hypothetical protein EOM50_05170 [Erysipelotrichia bacterium]|nr:hypothetical protein [Erysipelotrichia bacterium]NCC54497.1 hypothetical protein [Erysipelotrichia bacterium]
MKMHLLKRLKNMKKFNRIILSSVVCASVLLMSGCNSKKESKDATIATKAINDDAYRIAIPFHASDMTQVHITYNKGAYDIEAAGKGLQRYASEYFNTSNYYLQEGQLLTRENSVGTYNSEGILKRKSGDNPFGLNPEKDSQLPISNSQSITVGSETVPICDVFEYDFVKSLDEDAEIEGVAFAIILDSIVVDSEGNKHTIADEQLKTIGEEAGRNLLTFVKDMPEVSSNTPIMIALYKNGTGDKNLPGTFFAVGQGKSSIDSFKTVDEQWVILPSEEANDLDAQVASQFTSMKNALFKFLPNDIAIIAKGFFVDKQMYELQIVITTQGKTYIQNEALVQYASELLSNFSSDSFAISVKVNANTDTFAMMQRKRGSKDVSIIMY